MSTTRLLHISAAIDFSSSPLLRSHRPRIPPTASKAVVHEMHLRRTPRHCRCNLKMQFRLIRIPSDFGHLHVSECTWGLKPATDVDNSTALWYAGVCTLPYTRCFASANIGRVVSPRPGFCTRGCGMWGGARRSRYAVPGTGSKLSFAGKPPVTW